MQTALRRISVSRSSFKNSHFTVWEERFCILLYQKPRRLTQKRVSESPRENLRDWSIKGVPPARLRAHCYVYISRLVAALSVTPVTSPSPLNGEAVSILNLASHSLPPLTGKAEEAGENDLSPFRTMFAYPPSLFED